MEAHQILTFFLSAFCNNYLLGFGLIYVFSVLAFSPPLSIFINAERNLQISSNSQSLCCHKKLASSQGTGLDNNFFLNNKAKKKGLCTKFSEIGLTINRIIRMRLFCFYTLG
jgi:hypothetical protein